MSQGPDGPQPGEAPHGRRRRARGPGLHSTRATTYVAGYRTEAGSPRSLLVTVSGRIAPEQQKITWTRGKNGDGPAERNLAAR